MVEAEVVLFAAPTCPICDHVEQLLAARGIRCKRLDVTTDREALYWLLRVAGRPLVPTVAAYGQIMIGFDPARLDAMLDGVHERATRFAARDVEEEQQLREGEEAVTQTLQQLEVILEENRRFMTEWGRKK